LGNPDFWQRFGFQPTRPLGLFSEYNAENSFLVLELKPETLKRIRGLVKYTPEFAECGC
jgi:putative acetyltransferase